MNNNNIYHQRNKERLLERTINRYDHEDDKEQTKEYYENNKKRLQEQTRINVENYLMKKRI